MSDNTVAVVIATLVALCFGGFLFNANGCSRLDSEDKRAADRNLSASRDKCIGVGNAWLDGHCIPKCMP